MGSGRAGSAGAKLGGGILANLIVFGLVGQIAWAVENVFFNTFLYNSVYNGASADAVKSSMGVITAINLMVAFSAVTAVVTTFLMGNLSDRVGRRKIFIALGYVIWGVTILAFSWISPANMMKLFGLKSESAALNAAAIVVIVMDCVMTFMGSTSNDSAFNAYVTDVTDSSNRAKAEGVLAVMPIVANIAVVGLGMAVGKIGYANFFLILGVTVSACGVIGLISIKESGSGVKTDSGSYFADLFYGFRPSVIRKNSGLYLTLSAVCLYSIGMQVYFPYLIIYLQKYLGLDLGHLDFSVYPPWEMILLGIMIVAALVYIAVIGPLMDKKGKLLFMIPALIVQGAGLCAASLAKDVVTFLIIFLPSLLAYLTVGIAMSAEIRDLTPPGKIGLFQGVRMIFFVLLPMVIGPTLGNIATVGASITYVDDVGVEKLVPTPAMYVIAGALTLLAIIPAAALIVRSKKKLPADGEAA